MINRKAQLTTTTTTNALIVVEKMKHRKHVNGEEQHGAMAGSDVASICGVGALCAIVTTRVM